MNGYLGEFYRDPPGFNKEQWVLYFIEKYGQIDGGHHKAWVLDQIARILNDAPITCMEARWENGYTELRPTVGTSVAYEEWVQEMEGQDDDDEYFYGYDAGVAP